MSRPLVANRLSLTSKILLPQYYCTHRLLWPEGKTLWSHRFGLTSGNVMSLGQLSSSATVTSAPRALIGYILPRIPVVQRSGGRCVNCNSIRPGSSIFILSMWPEVATVCCRICSQSSYIQRGAYLRLEAAIVTCGQRPQDFLYHISQWNPGEGINGLARCILYYTDNSGVSTLYCIYALQKMYYASEIK